MKKINPQSIHKYIDALRHRGEKNPQVKKKITSVKKFIDWLYQQSYINKDSYYEIKKTIENINLSLGQKPKLHFNFKNLKEKLFSPKTVTTPPFSQSPLAFQRISGVFGPHHYIAFLIILLFISFLGAGLYNRLFVKVQRPLAYPQTLVRAGRTLNFQGRLTDSLGNPITTSTNMQFRLYNVANGGTPLYQTGACSITPDQDGIFNVIIGSDCGFEIPNSVFTENTSIYLGVTIGADSEMIPRQPIANVGYAINAETLQGFPPGNSTSTIPFINKDGDLLIGVASPGIRSTYSSANFTLSSAKTAIIQAAGTGDVILQATESGTITLRTGGTTDVYTHLFVDNTGNVGIGTTIPSSFKLEVAGNIGPEASGIRDLGSSSRVWNNIYANNIVSGSSTGTQGWWQRNAQALSPTNITDDLLLGATATTSALIKLTGTSGNNSWIKTGNIGIGTSSPSYTLDVLGTFRTSGNSYFGSNVYFAGGITYYVDSSGNAKFLDLIVADPGNPGLTIGNGSIGFLKIGSSTIFDNNTNYLAFDPNSDTTPEIVITDTGNIGIGTTNPASLLDVNGTAWLRGTVGGTSGLYVNTSGNVGIGTTGPAYNLDVVGDIRSTGKTYLGTSGFYAQYEYKTTGDVAGAGWYRIATIQGSAGRGQQQVTIYTTGGSYTPRSTTFRWYHDWTSGAGVSVISEIGSGYWSDVRVTDDGTNSFLEVNFTQTITGLNIGLQFIGGHDKGTIYSGELPAGGGTVRVTSKANGLFALNDKLIVDANGNIGIGTTNPASLLDVNGTAWLRGTVGGTSGLYVNTSGNVGIGTTAPSSKLRIDSAFVDPVTNNNAILTVYATDAAAQGKGGSILFGGMADTLRTFGGIAGLKESTNASDFAGYLTFYTRQSGGNQVERMRVTSTGNIGIGTTNPASLLDVNGTAWLRGTVGGTSGLYVNSIGNVGVGTTEPGTPLEIKSSSDAIIRLRQVGGGWNYIEYYNDTARTLWMGMQTDSLFAINGQMHLNTSSGYVGIGTTNPSNRLVVGSDLTGASAVPGNTIAIGSQDTSSDAAIQIGESTTAKGYLKWLGVSNYFEIGTASSSYPVILNPGGGNVGIGTTAPAYRLELPNVANASGQGRANAWVTYSDIRLKKNVQPIENALDKVLALRGVTFDWKEQNVHSSGFIAQQVESIIPDLVSTDVNGYKSLDYGRFTPYLVEAIKEQQNQIDKLNLDLSLSSTGDLNIVKNNQLPITNNQISTNDSIYQLVKNTTGEVIDRTGAFAKLVVAKIRTGLIDTKEIVVEKTLTTQTLIAQNLSLTTEHLTIAGKTLAQYIDARINEILNSRQLSFDSKKIISPVVETDKLKVQSEKLKVVDQNEHPIAEFNTQNQEIGIFGVLNVKNDQEKGKLAEVVIKGLDNVTVARIDSYGNASFSGRLTAKEVASEKLNTHNLESKNATISGTLAASEATLSGKLIAKEVEAQNITSLTNKLENTQTDINEIQQLLAEIKNTPLPDLSNQTNLSTTTDLTDLTVTNNTNLYNLYVSNSSTLGNLLIENDKILSLSSELKLAALSQINFYDGVVIIAKDGTITAKGALIAKGGVRTNEIRPIDDRGNISIVLNSNNQTPTGSLRDSKQLPKSKFQITNELGDEVASVDASGSAYFKEIALEKFTPATPEAAIIAASDNFEKHGIFAPAIETATASAGIGILPANQNEVVIYTQKAKKDSLIYLTENGHPTNTTLTVAEKADGYFRVISPNLLPVSRTFDWLIIN